MTEKTWSNDEIAAKIAAALPDGAYVTLGPGRPEAVANHGPPGTEIILQSENGLLGMGGAASDNEKDLELVNAGKKPIVMLPGGAFFHHADSFAMIRGGHLDVCVLGGYQVAANGDVANWSTGKPGAIPAVGGAMDLGVGAKQVFVLMTHTTKEGEPKLVEEITYPATARGACTRVYTDLAVLAVANGVFIVEDMVDGMTLEELQKRTAAPLKAN